MNKYILKNLNFARNIFLYKINYQFFCTKIKKNDVSLVKQDSNTNPALEKIKEKGKIILSQKF
jgi:hypothetical protein